MPLSHLNAEQTAAVSAPSGYNLIIASAGTGKTSTIVGRIAYLLQKGLHPSDILLLTFTNKASQEMIARLEAFSGKVAKDIEAGTFHAVAYRYLRKHRQIHLKQPKELQILFKSIYDKRVFGHLSTQPPYSAHHLFALYSLFLNAASSDSFGTFLTQKNESQAIYAPIYDDMILEFCDVKTTHHYADYNDLLLLYRAAMLDINPPYKEVLCDEYQDTNPLQDSIIDALKCESLFCVGDYDQSIYAFNGADISIIGNFTQKYPNAHVFSLVKNYRSSKAILQLANNVIRHNERIYPKDIQVIKQGNFPPPKLLWYDELFLQYQGIAKHIASSNRPFEDMAIIFRNNASADGIEASLRELKIPSRRKGSMSFFDSKEVRLILDISCLIHNPRDMMAYIHTLSYGRGIGNSVAKDIYDALFALGKGDCHIGMFKPNADIRAYQKRTRNAQLGLFDDFFALESASRFNSFITSNFASHPILSHPKIQKDGAMFLSQFYTLIESARQITSPTSLVQHIVDSILFNDVAMMLAKERSKSQDGLIDKERYDNAILSIKRKGMLLCDLAKNYDNVGSFLNAMILNQGESSEGNGVHLLTVHSSKGLEFESVYVVDLMEERFPNTKLMSNGGSLEEERRLFYVATTRAKEQLILSFAKRDALKNKDYKPSRFLYEGKLLSKDKVI